LVWKKTTKPRRRTTLTFNSGDKISFSLVRNNYVCVHYSPAYLSMMDDFFEIKEHLQIINKSFLTLGKPLHIDNSNVYIRDTKVLSPGGCSSLESLGKLYSNESTDLSKKINSKEDLNQMSKFLERDREAFIEYAVRDAVITLKHAISMEQFNFGIKLLGVPVTFSSLGRNYVLHEWRQNFEKHFPYQITGEYLMGNSDELQTPKGPSASGDVGLHKSYYIGKYKGGRNESFMYGTDDNTYWYDYDLVNAYTTAMADLSLPFYSNGRLIDPEDINSWNTEDFLKGYLIVNCSFKFNYDVKYPSIPCYIDESTTIYPLSGSSLLTGLEYILAKNNKQKQKTRLWHQSNVSFLYTTKREIN